VNAREFLELLWTPSPPGYIQLWRKRDKASMYYQAPAGVALTARVDDLYTGVGLAHKPHGKHTRARADQVVAIAGLWLDIDIDGGPEHKTGGVRTTDHAFELAFAITPPAIVVGSGYGLHAWYLFDAPWRFTSREEQRHAATMAAQWYALHRARAHARGGGLDHTHDLARLLRLPGTVNTKGGSRADVEVVRHDNIRHNRARLAELCDQAGPLEQQLTLDTTAGAAAELREIPPAATLPAAKLEALIENSDEFARTWRHQRPSSWSLSEYDLALCSLAAGAGWTNVELAALVVHHRGRAGDDSGKAQRLDYLRRTIQRARSGAGAAAAQLDRIAEERRRAA